MLSMTKSILSQHSCHQNLNGAVTKIVTYRKYYFEIESKGI